MKVYEVLYEEENKPAELVAPKLIQVLRTLIAQADQRGTAVYLHFDNPKSEDIKPNAKNLNINKIMQNVGGEHFDYDTFVAAYETDERVKSMIKNYSEKGIDLKTQEEPSDVPQSDSPTGGNAVNQMAKSATDLGAKL